MKYKQIGNSGLITSNLTLGTMILGRNLPDLYLKKEAISRIDHYMFSGGNHIDTADVDAREKSEKIVGKALKKVA